MNSKSGQIIVLFAGGLVGLVALCALAIDLSMVFSTQRMEKSAADEAALAGAQDLQPPGSRGVGSSDYQLARTHALANLKLRLGGTATCATSSDIVDCPIAGTPYLVSIKTPSPSAMNVDPSRAVQVSVRNPAVQLTFARVFGQTGWNVGETSVAGLDYGGQYAVITLRPPAAADRTGNTGDITIGGTGGEVAAISGDIGMNTGATLNGHSATVFVAGGYYVRYYGATATNQYSTPPGATAQKQLRSLIPDPKYLVPLPVIASHAGAIVYASTAAGIDTSATCTAAKATVVANGYETDASSATCLKPGWYTSAGGLSVANHAITILEPGVYWFDGGIDNKGDLIGGYDAGVAGVAVIVPQSQAFGQTGGGGGSSNIIALNRGSAYDLRAGGTEAKPAVIGTTTIETNTTPPMILSVIVPGSPSCTVTIPAPACNANTINWTGSGNATVTSIAGVVYAPSDNTKVAGNSDPKGYLGQLVAWTIWYTGNSTLNQHFPGAVQPGFVRLDTACSGGNTICNP